MRVTGLFGKTQREIPSEAETVSHQLLLRAGLVSQLAAGIYSYLPLAWRVLGKIETIIRQEMEAAGGQELHMPVLQPLELWQETGRDQAFGKGLFTLTDRRERPLALGPTHEEVITGLVRDNVQSYRDLPLLLYQLQTKFRDEPRPRGGLIRVREFTMKDLYSFDKDEEGLEVNYQKMLAAYANIYRRCGLPALVVEADSGAIGGKDSHEFMLLADTGEDEIVRCPSCGYAANVEKARSRRAQAENGEAAAVEEVATPGKASIEEVASFLGVPQAQTLKAVFYVADGETVFVVIRGDIEVNEVKLKNVLKAGELRMASEAEVVEAGIVAGAASPVGVSGIRIIADESVTSGTNFVAGGNKPETHLRNVNYPRDFTAEIIADIALARAGEGCPGCQGQLVCTQGIEVGHVFKLGTAFSGRLGANFTDEHGEVHPIIMGCYGIGVGRLLSAAIEQSHDDLGIIWPVPIAPYQVYLCPLYREGSEVDVVSEKLYEEFQAAGLEVLLDDRTESPGVKFNDADLIGIPFRVTVGPRTLKEGNVELKARAAAEAELVPVAEITARLSGMIQAELAV